MSPQQQTDAIRQSSPPERRRSVFRWVRLAFTYLPLVLAVPILIVGTFYSDLFTHIPLAALLAVMAIAFLGIAAHLDTSLTDTVTRLGALEQSQRTFVAEAVPVIRVVSLGRGFELLRRKVKRIGTYRVFAASSKDIYTFTRFHEFALGQCKLLVRGFQSDDARRAEAASHGRQVVADWRSLARAGHVEELTIRSYDFLPTEFQVIIDEEFMLLGLYQSDPTDYRELKVLNAVLIDGSVPTGRDMILEYSARFDSLFETCRDYHGGDVYNE